MLSFRWILCALCIGGAHAPTPTGRLRALDFCVRAPQRKNITPCLVGCYAPCRLPPKVLEIGKTTMVVSVPRELSSDHSAVLLLAEASGRITEADISERLQWEGDRPRRVLDELVQVFRVPNCNPFSARSAVRRSSCGMLAGWVGLVEAVLLRKHVQARARVSH